MGFFDDMLGGNSAVVGQLAKQFGITEEQAREAMRHMTPAIGRGMQQAEKKGGMGSLIEAINGGDKDRYIDEPEILGKPEATRDGNIVLGEIFNNDKDVSRNIGGYAAKKTGLPTGMMKMMLPILASIVMGYLSKQRRSAPIPQSRGHSSSGGGLGGLLGSLLDSDKDGSIADDLIRMATRYI
ncbi:MAG: hypothetical protein DSZ33_06480 [Gammaproteobacteria bacterium]|nr:MAG: hypothetical protein DSZ33_06480 [Gammaproteobacteria bacterium]